MLQEFLQYLATVRRFSPLTVQNYRRDVTNFLEWLDVPEADFDPRRITVEDVREWIVHRTETKHLGAASMNRELSSCLLYTSSCDIQISRTFEGITIYTACISSAAAKQQYPVHFTGFRFRAPLFSAFGCVYKPPPTTNTCCKAYAHANLQAQNINL